MIVKFGNLLLEIILYIMYYRDACEKYWGEDLKQLVIDRGKNNKGRKL